MCVRERARESIKSFCISSFLSRRPAHHACIPRVQGEQETGRVRLEHDAHSHWLGCAAVGPGAAMKDIHWSGISTAPQPFNVYLPFVPRLSMEGPSLADLELLLREIRAYEGLF